MFRKIRARIALAALLLIASAGLHAEFHFMEIREVYSNASGTVQFIELNMLAAGQNQLSGLTITSTQGATTNSFTFPGNNPSIAQAGRKILLGTMGYAALPNVPAPDYIIPNGFVFTSNMSLDFAGVAGFTAVSVPTDGTLSIDLSGATATNSPTNNAGVSGTVVLGTQNTAPAAPTIGTATGGNAQATISFTPGANGGSPITGFTATCASSGQLTRTGTGTASPITVNMLTNGVVYSCSVTATNMIGTSPSSAAVNVMPTAPVTVPDAPSNVFGTAGNMTATLNFNSPANGCAISCNFTASCGGAQSGGPSSPITVSGLANGTTYSCTVAATNSAGTGPPSSPVNVTPVAPGTRSEEHTSELQSL